MPKVEEYIKEYIKDRTKEARDGIRIPLSSIAEDLNYPTVTIWRAVQKLKERHIIKVVKSPIKTKPDKIYYLGEGNNVLEIVEGLIENARGTLIVLYELKSRLKKDS